MTPNSPLAGIRVVDLSRVFAMPYVGAYLADMGAEVIKIDTHHAAFVDTTRTLTGPYPDNEPGKRPWNRAGTFHTLNRGKRSLTLDLRQASGMDALLDLVAVSDVVLENFTPRVTRRFGLDYPHLRNARPDLILVSNTGYGHSGPWSDFGAMASALEPTHGSGAFMGYLEERDGRPAEGAIPNKIGNSYTDFLACWSAQLAIMAALYRRAQTGLGVWVDLAMYQTGVSFMGEGLLDFAFNGRRTRRMGNRHGYRAPHGCYPCRGDDAWLTISVRDDEDWLALCTAMGQPDLADDPRFAEPISRHRHQDELDAIIARWTEGITPVEAADQLNALGVPAGPALNAGQMLRDPHLRHRGIFESVNHPAARGLGVREYLGRGWRLDNADVKVRGPAPDLGEANDFVLAELLALPPKNIAAMRADQVIGEELLGGSPPNVVPLERQVELGWVAGYERDFDVSQ